jgi:hypothetical protein
MPRSSRSSAAREHLVRSSSASSAAPQPASTPDQVHLEQMPLRLRVRGEGGVSAAAASLAALERSYSNLRFVSKSLVSSATTAASAG